MQEIKTPINVQNAPMLTEGSFTLYDMIGGYEMWSDDSPFVQSPRFRAYSSDIKRDRDILQARQT